jgi:Fic-DOC domain mobile mystery protein B
VESLNSGDSGSTPLDEEALDGLIPTWVSTRDDLNEVEAENVAAGYQWLAHQKLTIDYITTIGFVIELHRKLFGDVWSRAGEFRKSNTNIGLEWFEVPAAAKQLVDNFAVRLTVSGTDSELVDAECVAYHHELVRIHPFPNGNGRHARACGDAAAVALDRPAFTWGRTSLASGQATRDAYIDARRVADKGHLTDLHRFARS